MNALDFSIKENKQGYETFTWACSVICQNFPEVSLGYQMRSKSLKTDKKLKIYL